MVNVDRIRELAKEQGIKLGYLTTKIGVTHTYFADVKNKNLDIPESRLIVIAEALGTTVSYLRGFNDIKEKSPSTKDELSPIQAELLNLMKSLNQDELLQTLDFVKYVVSRR